jgi:hypothetical protein
MNVFKLNGVNHQFIKKFKISGVAATVGSVNKFEVKI